MELDHEQFYLVVSPNMKCWEREHMGFLLLAGTIWSHWMGCYIPTISVHLLEKKTPEKENLNSIRKRGIETIKKTTQNNEFYLKFFYKDYKSSYYFWELVVFMQKFAFNNDL